MEYTVKFADDTKHRDHLICSGTADVWKDLNRQKEWTGRRIMKFRLSSQMWNPVLGTAEPLSMTLLTQGPGLFDDPIKHKKYLTTPSTDLCMPGTYQCPKQINIH